MVKKGILLFSKIVQQNGKVVFSIIVVSTILRKKQGPENRKHNGRLLRPQNVRTMIEKHAFDSNDVCLY